MNVCLLMFKLLIVVELRQKYFRIVNDEISMADRKTILEQTYWLQDTNFIEVKLENSSKDDSKIKYIGQRQLCSFTGRILIS